MKAAVLTDSGVAVRDVEQPKPAPSQVLVRVRAAGLNRADLIMASGHRHGNAGGLGTVLGLEFAGEVEAVGSEVKTVRPGDRVMCSGSGGYAEYAVAGGACRRSRPTTWATSRRRPCLSPSRPCTMPSSPTAGSRPARR